MEIENLLIFSLIVRQVLCLRTAVTNCGVTASLFQSSLSFENSQDIIAGYVALILPLVVPLLFASLVTSTFKLSLEKTKRNGGETNSSMPPSKMLYKGFFACLSAVHSVHLHDLR